MPGSKPTPTVDVNTDDLLFNLLVLPRQDRLAVLNQLAALILEAEAKVVQREAARFERSKSAKPQYAWPDA